MFDFKDFLAAMAIEDSMEEDKDSPSRCSSGSTKKETTTGCLFACAGIFIAVGVGFVFESLWLLIGISIAGIVFGIIYDIISGKKKGRKGGEVLRI